MYLKEAAPWETGWNIPDVVDDYNRNKVQYSPEGGG